MWEYLRDNRCKFDSDHGGVCPPNTFDDFPLEAHDELPKYQRLDHDSLVCLRQKELLLKKLIEFMNKENSQLLAQFKCQLQADIEEGKFLKKPIGPCGNPSLI